MDTPEITEETEPATPASPTRTFAKAATGFAVSVSVKSVVSTIVKQSIVPKTKFQNVELVIAAWSLGALAAKHASDAAEEKVDAYADRIKWLKQKAAEIEVQIEKSKTETAPTE